MTYTITRDISPNGDMHLAWQHADGTAVSGLTGITFAAGGEANGWHSAQSLLKAYVVAGMLKPGLVAQIVETLGE